ERSFLKRPIWQRALIIAAGPLFNFLLAFILAAIMIGTMGISEPVISLVTEDFPAEEAGLKEGDRIISLNNYDVHFTKR
ncbi:MAG: site-2 protease family protein, partial [Lachnospiraceae bacterium]|nr:site-2 protease family protein [Lachnospiraceae bacterium]